MNTEPGFATKAAGYGTACTGILAVAAGVQVSAFFSIRTPWARDVPPVEMLLGSIAVVAGGMLATSRGGARLVALLGNLTFILGGSAWLVWLTMNGVFSPIQAFVPGFALASVVPVLLSWRDVGRLAAFRKTVAAENARLLAEAEAAADPLFSVPQTSTTAGKIFGVVAGGTLLTIVSVIVLAVIAPDKLESLALRGQGMLLGVNPFSRPARVVTHEDFQYSGSPLLWYAEYEDQWLELDVGAITDFADGVASDVAWRLVVEAGTSDLAAAERNLWDAKKQSQIPLWIAEAIRRRGVFYHGESLLSRSFDPEANVVPDTIHLDCDELVYVFLHVAEQLDLAMYAVPSPIHMYLQYDGPGKMAAKELTIETTAFRRVDIDGNHIDYMGEGLGEDFFIDADFHSSGRSGTGATPDMIEAARFYEPAQERIIRDSIVSNVQVGLKENGITAPMRAELEAHAPGSHDSTLVANLFGLYLADGRAALERGDAAGAMADAKRAAALRAEHGALVVTMDPVELVLLADAQNVAGDHDGASATANEALAYYVENGWVPGARAWTISHAGALLALGDAHMPLKGGEAELLALPVLMLADAADGRMDAETERACALLAPAFAHGGGAAREWQRTCGR